MFPLILLAKNKITYSRKEPDRITQIPRTLKEVVIPSFVKVIDENACDNSEYLETLEFEEDSYLCRISKYAFRDCQNLRYVDFSPCKKLWAIENGAFYHSGIEEMILPESLKNIEKLAFSETQLRLVKIPDQTIWIGEKAFFQSKLEEVTFGYRSRLHQIEAHAFAMTNLMFIALPPLLEEIKPGAFAATPLMNITFMGENPTFEVINETIVTKVSKRLVASFVRKDANVDISPSVIEIGPGSFVFSKLYYVTIPPSVLYIRERAFAFSNLIELTIPKNVLLVEKYAFLKCGLLQKLKIESGSTALNEKSFSQTGLECGVKCPLGSITMLRYAGVPVTAFQKCPTRSSVAYDDEIDISE